MRMAQCDIVVSECDWTGEAARPWAEAGYTCYCVDIKHSIRNDRIEKVGDGKIIYVWGDARGWLPPERSRLAFYMAWSPCTDVAVSGARDFLKKGPDLLADAIRLHRSCERAARFSGAPYMLENPVGVLSTHIRKADYTFDPCDYAGYADDPDGEAYTKKTCLWTGNGFVMPPIAYCEPRRGSMMHRLPPTDDRAEIRSKTPQGFARAVFKSNHLLSRDHAIFNN